MDTKRTRRIRKILHSWNFDKSTSVPLYRQLEHTIIREIRKGTFKPGEILPSIAEMDEHLDLARVTIVNTMRELVKDGFASARHGKGYYVTELGEKALLGMVLPIHAYYFLQVYVNLISGVQFAAEQARHRINYISSDEDPETFIQAIDDLIFNTGCRWLLAVPPIQRRTGEISMVCVHYLERIQRRLQKLIVVDRPLPESDFTQIIQNRAAGEKLLLSEAARKGAKRVLFLDGNVYQSGTDKRLTRDAAELGMEIVFAEAESPERNLNRIQEEKCDAVLCGSDIHARRLMNICKNKPEFLLAGYDATPIATSFLPRITTVNPDLMAMGNLAFELFSGQREMNQQIYTIEPILVKGDTL